MLYIALCDGNDKHLYEIKKCLTAILFDKCEFKINTFLQNDELLSGIKNNTKKYDIIFTEQHMKPFSGLQVAKAVLDSRADTEVVVITTDGKYALEGYKYRLFDYMIKPVNVKQFKNVINRYIEYSNENNEYFDYKIRTQINRVKLDDILYFESSGRQISIIGTHDPITFYNKLDDIDNELKVTYFIRAHKSYLVNVHYIKSLTRAGITLEDGTVLPVSRNHYNYVKEKFIDYLSEGI